METLVLSSFGLLSLVALVVKKCANPGLDNANDAINKSETETLESKYKKLQWKFFSAYFLALLGDWLQGPYVYQVNKDLLKDSSFSITTNLLSNLFVTSKNETTNLRI